MSRPFTAVVARARPDAIAEARAALVERRTLLPLHPRVSPAERARLIARVSEADIPEGTAAILATSGSTGEPKLCALGHDAMVASARASRANIPLGPGDRWLMALSFAHAGGLSILTRCLEAGADVVPLDGDGFDEARALETIRDARVTHVSVVPTMLAKLLAADRADTLARTRAVLVGGAACPPNLYETAVKRGVPVLTTYGLTEAGSQVTTQRLDDPEGRTAGDSGVPLEGTSVVIENDRVVVRGPTLMHGYLGAPPLGGVLVTEDVGRIDERGRLVILGRADDMIITGGENVHPLEVERALIAIAGVRAALVVGAPDPEWGAIVCAAVVLAEGVGLDRVSAIARDALPRFRVPRRFVVLDALPVAPSGKPDRRAVRTLFGT